MRRPLVGMLCRACGAIPVERPQDIAFDGAGLIIIISSNKIIGKETNFDDQVHIGDQITSNNITFVIEEKISNTELKVKHRNETKIKYTNEYYKYKVLPRVNQTEVYDSVTDYLRQGGALGIFPEGGSHDRTKLLPLKPGVAIMALNGMLNGCEEVTIVPIGLNYFNENIFRSTAIITVGEPFLIKYELSELYKNNKKEAIDKILELVENGMYSTIVPAEDYREYQQIKLCSRLLLPSKQNVPSVKLFKLMQIFSKMFSEARKTDSIHFERYSQLRTLLSVYNNHLRTYGISDNDVWKLNMSTSAASIGIFLVIIKAILLFAISLPFIPLWVPMFIICEVLANKHRLKALKESNVKVKATDVLASYKTLIALVVVPIFNTLYSLIVSLYFSNSILSFFFILILALILFPYFEYKSMRFVEKLPDLYKSGITFIGALLRNINTWRDSERELIALRTASQLEVRAFVYSLSEDKNNEVINNLTTEIFQIIPKLVLERDSSYLLMRDDGEFSPTLVSGAYYTKIADIKTAEINKALRRKQHIRDVEEEIL